MWRTLIPFLSLLIVFARPASSEEVDVPPDAINPARVARMLLSSDEAERGRGTALLLHRMEQGGDVQTWLVAMARAQESWANAEERLIERWIHDVLRGTPARADKARRLLAAVGRDATQRLLQTLKDVKRLLPQQRVVAGQARQSGEATPPPGMPSEYMEPQSDAPPPPPDPQPPTPPQRAAPAVVPTAPVGRILAEVVELPSTEILASLAAGSRAQGADAPELAPIAHGQAVVVAARGVLESAASLPEARVRPVVPSKGLLIPGRPLVLVQGDVVRYRSRARRTKSAWAVDTDILRRGLHVSVRLDAAGGDEALEIEARYVSMPDPLATELVRPAGDVEPLELDRPEWESASMRLRTPVDAARDDVVAFFPGLVPGKVVVVSLRLAPLAVAKGK